MLRRVGIELEYMTPYSDRVKQIAARMAKSMGVDLYDDFDPGYDGNILKCLVLKEEASAEVEFNSPFSSDLELFKPGFDLLPELGKGAVSRRCGLHVHVDLKGVGNYPGLIRVLSSYLEIEEHLFKIQPTHRSHNSYCSPLLKRPESVRRFLEGAGSLDWFWYGSGMGALTYHKRRNRTLEFRMGNSSLCSRDILNWADLCRRVVEIGRSRPRGPYKARSQEEFLQIYCTKRLRNWYLEKLGDPI